jgi:CRP/FNR family transcriptional regulator, cyclic AMP receptor protein
VRSPDGLGVVGGGLTSLTDRQSILGEHALKALTSSVSPRHYPKGAVLFAEGQRSRGLFVMCSGTVKLYISSPNGKVIILKIAQAGELVGLHAALSGKPYELTAEVSEKAQINLVRRAAFLRFLRTNSEALRGIAGLLMDGHYAAHDLVHSLMLSRSASEKLARLSLTWAASHGGRLDGCQIGLTHEEIGEMIGVSRETVSRLLGVFQRKHLLAFKRGTVTVCNRAGLENLVRTEAAL